MHDLCLEWTRDMIHFVNNRKRNVLLNYRGLITSWKPLINQPPCPLFHPTVIRDEKLGSLSLNNGGGEKKRNRWAVELKLA